MPRPSKGPKLFRASPKYFGRDQNILELCQKEKFTFDLVNTFCPDKIILDLFIEGLYNPIITPMVTGGLILLCFEKRVLLLRIFFCDRAQ